MIEQKPWGTYEIIYEDTLCKVKRIVVDPKQRLSFQMHRKRSESWSVIQGKGEVLLSPFNVENYITEEASPGAYFIIPSHYWHRIHNTGTEPLIFIEIQTGSYFGEDDIVRAQDDYGRI